MSAVGGVVSAVFWGLLVLSVLVFVHEGGHYLAARALGVRVTEFFLGLPCRLKLSRKSKKVGTELGVTPILLGGYTRICGMEGEQDELLAPVLACVQSRGRISAQEVADQVGCDIDRAYDCLAVLSDWASIRPYYDPEKGEKPGQRDYPESFETLQRDANMLTEYDRAHDFGKPGASAAGEPRPVEGSPEDFLAAERSHTYLGCGFWKRFCMLFAGPLVNLVLAFVVLTAGFAIMGQTYGVNSNVLGGIADDSYAQSIGLQAGDTVTQIGDQQVTDWYSLGDAVTAAFDAGQDFDVTYERDGQSHTEQVHIDPNSDQKTLGVYAQTRTYHPSFLEACSWTVQYTGMVVSFAVQLVMPQHTMEVLDSSTSIVGISVMASEAASEGLATVLAFAAAISLSLGIMNLLPIPPLDGGKILIEIITALRRRPVSLKTQSIISYAGMAFFLFVFVVVLKNDIFRFVIG